MQSKKVKQREKLRREPCSNLSHS